LMVFDKSSFKPIYETELQFYKRLKSKSNDFGSFNVTGLKLRETNSDIHAGTFKFHSIYTDTYNHKTIIIYENNDDLIRTIIDYKTGKYITKKVPASILTKDSQLILYKE